MTNGRPVSVFDDGYRTDYGSVWPVLREAGAPACLAVVPEWVGGPGSLDRSQPAELVDAGREVAAHGARHPCSNRSASPPTPRRATTASRSPGTCSRGGPRSPPRGRVRRGRRRRPRDGPYRRNGSDGDGRCVSFERGLDAGYAAAEATLRPTEATLRDEVVGPRETLREWGFDPRTFVLPYDASDARAWSLVCDRYDALANAAVRSLPNPPGTPPTSLRRYYLETDQLTRTGVGDYLDAVADVGGLGVLAGHSAWETVPPERVRWVVAAARDRGIELATFRDVPG